MQRQREHVLVVTAGPNLGERYQLREMVSTFGRTAGNTIVLDSTQVSRHHAQIRLTPGGAVIEDIGSTNGTWVNDRRLVEPQALANGDRIRLADFVTLEYSVRESSGTEVLPAAPSTGATQAMGGAIDFDVASPPRPGFTEPVPVEPFVPDYQGQMAYPAQNVHPAQPDVVYGPAATAPRSRRPQVLYGVIGVLVVLICLCVALAIYLWFAPLSFWERLFDLLGIPLPTSTLVGRLSVWL
ncbi:MAG: FHA domain-containing protein [Anaerolineae bacterium]|jgi:predicted component of type VI protein secretion system|nr:FHA domain-containing protein [Anaerolineae bacterium]